MGKIVINIFSYTNKIIINLLGLAVAIYLTFFYYNINEIEMCKLMSLSGMMHVIAIVFSTVLEQRKETVEKQKKGNSL
jgi:uncharacterized membrane protein